MQQVSWQMASDLRLKSASDDFAALMGFSSVDEAVGKTSYDLKCPAVLLANEFQREDREVFELQKNKVLLAANVCKNKDVAVWVTKKHYIKKNNEASIYAQSQLFSFNQFHWDILPELNLHSKDSPYAYEICDGYSELLLSKSETIIFFYLIRGYTCAQIADIICRSKRTVEAHSVAIYQKTNLNKRSDIIGYAIAKQLFHILPTSLFQKMTLQP